MRDGSIAKAGAPGGLGQSASSSALPDATRNASDALARLREAHGGRSSGEAAGRENKTDDDALLGLARPLGGGRAAMFRAKSSAALSAGGTQASRPDKALLEGAGTRNENYRDRLLARRGIGKLPADQHRSLELIDRDKDNKDDPERQQRDREQRERETRERRERRRRANGEAGDVPEMRATAPEIRRRASGDASAAGSALTADALARLASPPSPVANAGPLGAEKPPPLFPLPGPDDEELVGGFRRGDNVRSLVSQGRSGLQILELGHEGVVIGQVAHVPRSRPDAAAEAMILIQFNVGFDWLLAPHQICAAATYGERIAAGLPGGNKWGDRICILVDRLNTAGSKRGLVLGDTGTVVGPGRTQDKVAVRLDGRSGEWSLFPGVFCNKEGFSLASVAELEGGLRRGDRVRAKATKAAAGFEATSCLEDGDEGTVLGPGHAGGRVLVKFDVSGQTWSLAADQVCPASLDLVLPAAVGSKPSEPAPPAAG